MKPFFLAMGRMAVFSIVLWMGSPLQAAETFLPVARQETRTFNQLGIFKPIRLKGLEGSQTIDFGIRLDESVKEGDFILHFTPSPALLPTLSHLKVYLNEELISTLVLEKEQLGKPQQKKIALEPRLLADFNKIRIQLIGHYQSNGCEDPYHSSLWTDLSLQSQLHFDLTPVQLASDLALLPAPFFDPRDNRRLNLTFVLPEGFEHAPLSAAGTVASWFGRLAAYREARFSVSTQLPPDQHAIVFALPDTKIEGITLPPIEGSHLFIVAHPIAPTKKVLIIAGKTPEALLKAAQGLVLGQVTLSGDQAKVETVQLGAIRQPYDAPNWIRTDRAVRFGELVNNTEQLQVRGYGAQPIRLSLRVPADLFGWDSQGVPLELKYRYTQPLVQDDSMLHVELNQALVQSYRLRPASRNANAGRVLLPVNAENIVGEKLTIPTFKVGSNNQLQFNFLLEPQKTGACTSSPNEGGRAAIDPDSTIDLSGLPHYIELPDLAAFANSGFPFTRKADLSDTAFILPDTVDRSSAETFLTLLGHMGKWTGLPATRFVTLPASQVNQAKGKDLLIIGQETAHQWLANQQKSLPFFIESAQRHLSTPVSQWMSVENWFSPAHPLPATETGRALIQSQGALAGLVGFESPFDKGRSSIALMVSGKEHFSTILDALEDQGRVSLIQGDTVIMQGKKVEGFRLHRQYASGELPIWTQIWFFISHYPMALAIVGGFAGLLVAGGLFWALSRMAARRLK